MRLVIVLFICMLFCHVFDDYFLQGCLANLKQKAWWQKNAPNELYKYDYVAGLVCHSISWTFMIMLPLALFSNWYADCPWLLIAYPVNITIHAITDDLKANKGKINLIQDQLIHLGQICFTLIVFILCNLNMFQA